MTLADYRNEWQKQRDALWTSLRKTGDGDWTPQDVRAQAHLEASTNYIHELRRLALDMGEALRWTDDSLSDVLARRPHRAIAEVHAANAAILARLDGIAGKDKTT